MRVVIPSTLTLVSSTADPSPHPAWNSGTSYVLGNTVSYIGVTAHVRYQASVPSTNKDPLTTSGYWTLRGVVPLWDAVVTYTAGAKVYLAAGASGHTEYTCRYTNLGKSPDAYPTYWTANGEIDLWDSGTAWVATDEVYVVYTYPSREYESLTSNLNKPPPSYPTDWLDLGPTNEYRLLDAYVSTQTTGVDAVTTVVQVQGKAETIALVNLTEVSSVDIEITAGGAVVYSQTLATSPASYSTSWSAYFFDSPELSPSFVADIPGFYNNVLASVTFRGSSGIPIGCGHLLIGENCYLGATQYGVDLGIKDYSRKETNDFGEITLVQRTYSKTMRARLELDPGALDFVSYKLAQLRATPCLYDANYTGGTQDALRVYGFYNEFSNTLEGWDNTICSLEITGLT